MPLAVAGAGVSVLAAVCGMDDKDEVEEDSMSLAFMLLVFGLQRKGQKWREERAGLRLRG
jgi:hypothetical protein